MIQNKLQNFVNTLPISPEKSCSYYPDRLSQIQYFPFPEEISKEALQFFSIPVLEETETFFIVRLVMIVEIV
ncbi:hypothetical protein LEP1GSC170_0664 [Leptospira interrogans serovar Bataviae str. HAI135]|nr:hypothetical protein LEP1GSC170_0664 [Leptospira interrogans serovar Bataviae str. HAI135]